MKILLTGANGFLGRVIIQNVKANIISLARSSADIISDLTKGVPQLQNVDGVIHAAGKAHVVPKTQLEQKEFFDTNVIGTANLLAGLEKCEILPKFFVFISSVAVYGVDSGVNITEDNSLAAKDAYGKSKIEAEELVQRWCEKNNVVCTILRLPLLVGKNPPGNLGAMVSGIRRGFYFNIGGGKARKSMVLASDVADIMVKVSEIGGVYNLTDRYNPSFSELSTYIAKNVGVKMILNMPHFIARALGIFGDVFSKFPLNSNKYGKITSDLTFNDDKAVEAFGWNPNAVLGNWKIK